MPDPTSNAPSRESTRGRNKPATVSLVLGIVGVVVYPIVLAGIGAIIFSVVGLNRANLMSQFGYAPVGKKEAIGGLALGLLGILEAVVLKNYLF